MKIIGHRGAAGLALENTAESIKAALALPIDGIEFDVRRTKDGKLVVMHDEHTGRVARRRVRISHSTLAELRGLDLHNGQQIPTLDEVLKLADNKKPLTLDIKDHGVAKELARVLARHPQADITISCREYKELEAMHRALPHLPFLAQTRLNPMGVIRVAKRLGATGVSFNKLLLNPYAYRLARQAGLEVRVYTINRPRLARLIAKLYPDAVMYTNHPERFVKRRAA